MLKELFGGLRALVLLRQIARELKRANDLAELRLSEEHPAVYKAKVVGKPKARPGVRFGPQESHVSTGSIEKWNERHKLLHPEDQADNPY